MPKIFSPKDDFLPLEEQIKSIGKIFNLDPKPALKFAKTLPPLEFNIGAEGWFAVPKQSSVFPSVRDARLRHCKAVGFIRKLLEENVTFWDFLVSKDITPNNFLMTKKTDASLLVVSMGQPGDIMIIPARLSPPHQKDDDSGLGEIFRELFDERKDGNSSIIRNEVYLNGTLVYSSLESESESVLERVFGSKFGFYLDAFSFGCILLAHRELLTQWEESEPIYVKCLGSRFDHFGGETFEKVPLFTILDGKVGLALTEANPSNDSNKIQPDCIGIATSFIGSYIKI